MCTTHGISVQASTVVVVRNAKLVCVDRLVVWVTLKKTYVLLDTGFVVVVCMTIVVHSIPRERGFFWLLDMCSFLSSECYITRDSTVDLRMRSAKKVTLRRTPRPPEGIRRLESFYLLL